MNIEATQIAKENLSKARAKYARHRERADKWLDKAIANPGRETIRAIAADEVARLAQIKDEITAAELALNNLLH